MQEEIHILYDTNCNIMVYTKCGPYCKSRISLKVGADLSLTQEGWVFGSIRVKWRLGWCHLSDHTRHFSDCTPFLPPCSLAPARLISYPYLRYETDLTGSKLATVSHTYIAHTQLHVDSDALCLIRPWQIVRMITCDVGEHRGYEILAWKQQCYDVEGELAAA